MIPAPLLHDIVANPSAKGPLLLQFLLMLPIVGGVLERGQGTALGKRHPGEKRRLFLHRRAESTNDSACNGEEKEKRTTRHEEGEFLDAIQECTTSGMIIVPSPASAIHGLLNDE